MHSLKASTVKNFVIKGGVLFDMSLDIPIEKTVMTEKEQQEEMVAVMVAIVVVVGVIVQPKTPSFVVTLQGLECVRNYIWMFETDKSLTVVYSNNESEPYQLNEDKKCNTIYDRLKKQ